MRETFATAAFVLLGACSSVAPGAMKTVAVDETFTLRILEAVRIDPEGIVLQFSEVASDSRCPEDVTCVWEGSAEVVLRATGSDERSAEIRLGTSRPRSARFDGIAIEIVAITPHPKEGVTPRQADYELTLRVTSS